MSNIGGRAHKAAGIMWLGALQREHSLYAHFARFTGKQL